MANLAEVEKKVINDIFNNSGRVLDYTDSTFFEFFQKYGININNSIYHKYGTSKWKRLRCFFEIEDDKKAGEILGQLFLVAEYQGKIKNLDQKKFWKIQLKN